MREDSSSVSRGQRGAESEGGASMKEGVFSSRGILLSCIYKIAIKETSLNCELF